MKGKTKKTLLLLSMVLPGALWFFLLRYIPMAGIVLAFKEYKVYIKNPGFWNNLIHSKWVGLKNFQFIFATKDSWAYVRDPLLYNIFWIVLGLVLAVTLAIILSEITQKRVAKVYQTFMFFPYFLSWVVASYFVLAFLDPTRGLLTHWQAAGGGEVINWYHEPKYWPVILTICNIWKTTGYSCVLYLAAITGIDGTQYEAAAIDGASKWQQIRYVTLPHLGTKWPTRESGLRTVLQCAHELRFPVLHHGRYRHLCLSDHDGNEQYRHEHCGGTPAAAGRLCVHYGGQQDSDKD